MLGSLTSALMAHWIFHPGGLMGGRVTTPFISAPVHRRAKRKTAFESLLTFALLGGGGVFEHPPPAVFRG